MTNELAEVPAAFRGISVTFPTPHELTQRVAKVLLEDGLLREFIVPFSTGGMPWIPSSIRTNSRLAQWHYPIPAVSAIPLGRLAAARAYRAAVRRRWPERAAGMLRWREDEMDRDIARRVRESPPGALWTMYLWNDRAERAAVAAGTPILNFLNGDAWGIRENLLSAGGSSVGAQSDVTAEIEHADVDAATRAMKRAAIVVAESARMGQQARKAAGSDKPVVLVGQGVAPEFFTPNPMRQWNAGPLRVAQVSRVSYSKGVHVTNEAIQLAASAVRSCTLLGWDGRSSPGLVHRSSAITFAGQSGRSGVRELLRCSDVLVHPALTDPMPRAVLEGMACGLPVITTAQSGYTDLIEDGVNGFIVPAGDAAAVAVLLVRLAADPELRSRVGAAARATAEANSWNAFSARFRGVLHAEILPMLEGLCVPRAEPVT